MSDKLKITGDETTGYIVSVKVFNFWTPLTFCTNYADALTALNEFSNKGYA